MRPDSHIMAAWREAQWEYPSATHDQLVTFVANSCGCSPAHVKLVTGVERQLRLAIKVAETALRGHTRRDGKTPSVSHGLAVAALVPYRLKPPAVVHDVVEDTEWSTADLLAHDLSPRTVELVGILTKCEGEPYDEYLARVAADEDALAIKLADMLVNLTDSPTATQAKKYQAAVAHLLKLRKLGPTPPVPELPGQPPPAAG